MKSISGTFSSAEEVLKETVNLINSRLFTLQRVIWTYKNAELEDAKRDWEAYRKQIEKWNFKDMNIRTRLDIYFGKNIANQLMVNKKIINKSDSIYDYFYITHRNVLDWKSCLRKACSFSQTGNEICKTNKCDKIKNLSEKSTSKLRKKINSYIDSLYFEYRKRYLKLEEKA